MRQYPHETPRVRYLMVIQGSPVEGFKLYGPFIDATEASDYAMEFFGPNGWDIIYSSIPTRSAKSKPNFLDKPAR